MRAQRRNEAGFTLIELMIAVTLSTIIVAAGFATLTGGSKATGVSNMVADTQQNARAAMDLIATDLKAAGFGMVPNGYVMAPQVGNCAIGGNAAPIVPSDNNPAGADTGPDRLSMVVPSTNSLAAPLWQLTAPPGGPGISNLTLLPAAVTAMQAVPSGLAAGSIISIDGVATATIGAIAGGVLNLNPPIVSPWSPGVAPAQAPTQVYLLQCITYQVIPPPDPIGLCQGNAPCLVRGVAPGVALDCNVAGSGCLPITNGIEDLQLSYACDGCSLLTPPNNNGIPDGIIDDQNGSNGFDQGDFISNNTWAAIPGPGQITPNTIRLVQITIVAREAPQHASQDQGFGEGNGRATSTSAPLSVGSILLPDHNHANGVFVAGDLPAAGPAMTAYQQLRRRVLTRTVALRNVGN
jgi:type IV pilus assembly protein PilW